jgi:hypothetical protein
MGIREFEEWEHTEELRMMAEAMFSFMRPEVYARWKKGQNTIKSEEGVDHVVYKGEDDWTEIDKELKEFGFTNLDYFGKTL